MRGVRGALRLLGFSTGGAAGELAAMAFAHVPMSRYAYDLFGLNFPLSLVPGLAAGALNGAGFSLGRFLHGRRLAGGRSDDSRIGVRTMRTLAVTLIALGVLYGIAGAQGAVIPSVVIVVIPVGALVLVSAGHGVVAGATKDLGAFGAAMLGLLFGPVGGGLFSFAVAVAYDFSYQEPPNPDRFSAGGMFAFVIILILGTGLGLGLGVVLACAQGIGRVASRIIGNGASGGPPRPVAGVVA
jgi:hypothetical protein